MKSKLLAAFLSLIGATVGLAQTATVPALLSYQGRVTDSNGNLIGSSSPVNRAVKFQLYTASSGGTPVWAETQTVTISGGEFSVLIGNGTGISGITGPSSPAPTPYKKLPDILNSSANTAGVSFYLGVTVDDGNPSTTDAEISPRQQLVAGAYALRATVAESVASGAVTTAMIADSNITTGKIVDSGVTSAKIADSTIITADLANNAVTAAKIDTNSIGLWNVNGGSVYRSSGNVGVGTSSPSAPLHVTATGNTLPDSNGLYVFNPTNSANQNAIVNVRTAGINSGSPFYSMDVAGINGWAMGLDNSDGQKFKISNSWSSVATNPRLTITPAGNVGIGQTNPGYPLSFEDNIGDKISLWGQYSSSYGFGIQGGLLQIHTDTAGADVAFGYGSSNNFNETMRIKGNGFVGIGTNAPAQKLTVQNGWLGLTTNETGVMFYTATSDWGQIYAVTYGDNDGALRIRTGDDGIEPIEFFQTNSYRGGFNRNGDFELSSKLFQINGGYNGGAAYVQMSLPGDGGFNLNLYNSSQTRNNWRTARYDGDSNWDFFSDRRLKKDIVDAEPMLDRLLQVRFRRFHWLTSGSDEKLEFGVIAQELEPLFPSIVGESTVSGETEPRKTVGYTEFATIAAKSIQELKARNDAEFANLRKNLEAKDAQIAALEARLAALEKLLTAAK